MSEQATESAVSWLAGTGLDTSMEGDVKVGSGGGMRYWMPQGTSKRVVFLTEGNAAPVLWEHQFRLGQGKGKWMNWLSCLQPLGVACPLCQWAQVNNEFGRYKGAFFTVVDTSKFTDRSGNERQNIKKLLVAKKDTAEILKRKYLSRVEAGEGLKLAMFEIFRTNSDKSASVGEDFEFVKMIASDGIPDAEEFNYSETLRPDPEKMSAVIEQLRAEKGLGATTAVSATSEGTTEKVEYE